jgi:hypothetical protein
MPGPNEALCALGEERVCYAREGPRRSDDVCSEQIVERAFQRKLLP